MWKTNPRRCGYQTDWCMRVRYKVNPIEWEDLKYIYEIEAICKFWQYEAKMHSWNCGDVKVVYLSCTSVLLVGFSWWHTFCCSLDAPRPRNKTWSHFFSSPTTKISKPCLVFLTLEANARLGWADGPTWGWFFFLGGGWERGYNPYKWSYNPTL